MTMDREVKKVNDGFEIDSFLSTRIPLDEKQEFSHFKSFIGWISFLVVYLFLVINVSNSDISFDNLSSEYNESLQNAGKKLDQLQQFQSNFGTLALGTLISMILSVVTIVVSWRLTEFFIKILIEVCITSGMIITLIIILSNTSMLESYFSHLRDAFFVYCQEYLIFFMLITLFLVCHECHCIIPDNEIIAVCEILKESIKAVLKFPLVIFILIPLAFSYYFASLLKYRALVGLIKFCATYQTNFIYFQLLNAIIEGTTWSIYLFIYFYWYMVLSKIYATWYWAEDKNSIDPFKTVFDALWTTARYDLGAIAYGLSPWSLKPIITTTWKNLSSLSNFKELPLFFKCFFTLTSIFGNFINGFCIRAYHNSDFPESTKFGGFLYFKNVIRFFSTISVLSMIVLFNWFVTFEAILTIFHESSEIEPLEIENEIDDETEYDEIEIEKFDVENLRMNMILFPTSMSLGIHIIASITTLLLCTTETSERNSRPTN